MALRVLLADESSTIKKAILMALSDLGVDVKSVPSGLDVLTVSRTYLPDLILADILLTKKNGYEVCAEIKNDPQLKQTPVVLMWSSFMQLDQKHFQRVRADASLEKPFDSEALRLLVEKFVSKTNQFPLKGLLNHPELPDFEESNTFVRQRSEFMNSAKKLEPVAAPQPPPQPPPPQKAQPQASSQSPIETAQMLNVKSSALSHQDAVDDLDDFAEMPLKPKRQYQPQQQDSPPQANKDEVDDWSSSSAEQFVVETESFGDFEEVTVMTNASPLDQTADLQKRIQDQLKNYIEDAPLAKNRALGTSAIPPKSLSGLEEQIMKEEIRMMAEKICWQILPDITEKIVREELNKLLNGLEKI